MKRAVLAVLLTGVMAASLAACGGGNAKTDGTAASTEAETGTDTDAGGEEAAAEEETKEEAEEDETIYAEFENAADSVSTIVDDGDYYFQVHSMGMTDEGYIISYTAGAPTKGYGSYAGITVSLNGIRIDEEQVIFRREPDRSTYEVSAFCTSRDEPAEILIETTDMDLCGLTAVDKVELEIELGHDTYSSFEVMKTADAVLYAGSKTDTPIADPANETLRIYDDDTNGFLQITGAKLINSSRLLIGYIAYCPEGEGCGYLNFHDFAIPGVSSCSVECYENPREQPGYYRMTVGLSDGENGDFSQVAFAYDVDSGEENSPTTTVDLSPLLSGE